MNRALFFVAVLALAVWGAYMVLMNSTRGLRNNNPGNIRKTGIAWLGKITPGRDLDFEEFESQEFGIRAIGRLLETYKRQGRTTIDAVIKRYAPASENDTEAYIASVEQSTGIDRDRPLDLSRDKAAVVAAIIKHENGIQPFSERFIESTFLLT